MYNIHKWKHKSFINHVFIHSLEIKQYEEMEGEECAKYGSYLDYRQCIQEYLNDSFMKGKFATEMSIMYILSMIFL